MKFDRDRMYVNEDGFGLLLGAGASYRAGYPLMEELTKLVLQSLEATSIDTVARMVRQDLNADLDVERGEPNIEVITDLIEARLAALAAPTHQDVEALRTLANHVRESIVVVMNAQESPCLDDHVRLFQALKRMRHGRAGPIWVFTTNYDLLIEWGAAAAQLPVFDGFQGSSLRFFDTGSLSLKYGTFQHTGRNDVFIQTRTPQVNLLKLHGSVNWWLCRGVAFSGDKPRFMGDSLQRAMVLPRRNKVRDVLEYPYEAVWRVADQVLGRTCKYLTSIGFSYGDQHLKDRLLLPKLQRNDITLTALVEKENDSLHALKGLPNFQCATQSDDDLWDFRRFVDYVRTAAGYEGD